jgi:hypothetical protein
MNPEENKNTPAVPVVVLDQNNQNNNSPSHHATDGGKEYQANADANNLEFGEEIRKMLGTAGTLALTDAQHLALYEPFKHSDVYLKPDGLVYFTWTKFAGRLTKAFGGTGWAMIPQGMPKVNNNLIVWGFHLVIKGVYCGFAIGEQQYFNNGRMTYGEACEGAKSNALTRLCKALGIGIELWDKDFINEWLDKYADKRWDHNANEGRGKNIWSLKPNAFGDTNKNTTSNLDTKTTPPTATPVRTVTATTITPVATITPVENTPPPPTATTTPAKTKAEVKAEVKGYTGKGKNKLAENTDFLKSGKSKDLPIEQISESELGPATTKATKNTAKSKFESFSEEMDKVKTTSVLKMLYNETIKKISYPAGEITDEELEILRVKANGLFVDLSAKEAAAKAKAETAAKKK